MTGDVLHSVRCDCGMQLDAAMRRIAAEGPPGEVITDELVAAVFGLEARVIDDPLTGTPMVVPVPVRHRPAPA